MEARDELVEEEGCMQKVVPLFPLSPLSVGLLNSERPPQATTRADTRDRLIVRGELGWLLSLLLLAPPSGHKTLLSPN